MSSRPPRSKDGKNDSQFDGTSVDLGEDLLNDATRILPGLPPPGSSAEEADDATNILDVPDELASAKILLNENLTEEAKRVLRKIIVLDPGHVEARKMLGEIHEGELKQIFGESSSNERRKRLVQRGPEDVRTSIDTIIENLDRDLSLGLFGIGESTPTMTVAIDEHLAPLSAKDHVDVGIAFFEMGLFPLAVQQFKKAAKDPGYYVEGSGLLALALIACNQAFDATQVLEPLIEDTDLEKFERVELLYLMGRAFERLHKLDVATRWFREVLAVLPRYRDVEERLRRVGG